MWWSRLIASFKRLAYISFLVGKTLTTGRPTATGNHSVPALAPAPGPTDSTGPTATGGRPTGPTILSTNKSIQSVELNKSISSIGNMSQSICSYVTNMLNNVFWWSHGK